MKPFYQQKELPLLDPDEILADSIRITQGDDHLEAKMERPINRRAAFLFLLFIGLGVAYLLRNAMILELRQGDRLYARSQENRFVTRPVFPPRGIIYDYLKKPFAENVPSLGLLFEKQTFLESGQRDTAAMLSALALLLKKDHSFFYEVGFQPDGSIAALSDHILIMQNLTPEEAVILASHAKELTGITIFENYRRMYQDVFANSHILGFLSRVSKDDLAKNDNLSSEDLIGKSGIEAFYDDILRGKKGKKIAEIDSAGKETRFKLTKNAKEGSGLLLTVDSGLQKISYDIIRNYTEGKKSGSIVILDPKNGAIRAMVSFPGFDANKFGNGLTQKDFEEITKDPLHPFFNRAIAGEFPSGSVIKPMVAAAALQENIITDPKKKIYDEGFIEIPNPYHPGEVSVFKDWRKQGWIDFYDAMAYSANVYFYMIGGGFRDQKGLGIQKLKYYANLFGLGSTLGIDMPGEKPGFFPDPSTKEKTDLKDPIWRIGDTYNTAIGQGGVKVTPLQMALLTAAITNGGTLYRPYLLDAVLNEKGEEIKKNVPHVIRDNLAGEENLALVRDAMRGTVTYGTARALQNLPVSVSAKTGTAQAGSGKPHAWVTAFAPAENPEIVAVVMVEHAGEGATVAVPIMQNILEWYFQNRGKTASK